MKFQKVLKEIIIRNRDSAKRLDEATVDSFINDWPQLVINQYYKLQGQRLVVNSYLNQPITMADNKTPWTGEMNDIIDKVKTKDYSGFFKDPSRYTINSSDQPMILPGGKFQLKAKSILIGSARNGKGEVIPYVSNNPTVVALVQDIAAKLKENKKSVGNEASIKNVRSANADFRQTFAKHNADIAAMQRKSDLGIK